MGKPVKLSSYTHNGYNPKYLFLTLILLYCFIPQAKSQNYKVKHFTGKGTFIIPPHSKLSLKKNGHKKLCYHAIHNILIHNLNDSYINALNAVDTAEYWMDADKYFTAVARVNNVKDNKVMARSFAKLSPPNKATSDSIAKLKHANGATSDTVANGLSFFNVTATRGLSVHHLEGDNFYICATDKDTHSTLYIEINYDLLMPKGASETEIANNFNSLATSLLIRLATQGEADYGWPSSISQTILEKVFELIPVPQAVSLARYGFKQTSTYSLLPLNPKIHLRVDHATTFDSGRNKDVTAVNNYLNQIKDRMDSLDTTGSMEDISLTLNRGDLRHALTSNTFRYEFTGQTIITLSKIALDKQKVFFDLDPFMGTQGFVGNVPNNDYPNTERRLLSSSIDLQFTDLVSTSPYLFLYQRFLRGNNSYSSSLGAKFNQCCGPDKLHCNTLVLYRNDMDVLNDIYNRKIQMSEK